MTSSDATRFTWQPCPYCGKPPPDQEASRPPSDGDLLVCFGCTEPAIYQTGPLGGYLRKPTPAEPAEFAVDHGHHVERLRRFLKDRPDR
ncbi:hypothetical protein [Amycolatopsis sp. FDAARGOS 1241]|uniref:hypothetical protein n=1 Tax=Amycolatopsis sp. FDAARGOS 1241 TaxID=2778070 RepID=UPI00194F8EE5|nr:hypothetical protein [Amycolatopsis sp. FDAARGOS 1241]QRP42792.1 hypothetical protein I6J71_25305 [Amycolatopsis sp. FDAARGOS 1241]